MQKHQTDESTAPMYWLKDGEFPSGPFTQQQLKSRLMAAELPASSYVCLVTGQEWLKLSEVLDLAPGAEQTPGAVPGDTSGRSTASDDRPPTTAQSAIASTAPIANTLPAWLTYIAKLAGLAFVGYFLFIRPWRVVKPPPRPAFSVQIEEERARQAEYQGRFDDAAAHRRRAAEERAYEEWKLRKER